MAMRYETMAVKSSSFTIWEQTGNGWLYLFLYDAWGHMRRAYNLFDIEHFARDVRLCRAGTSTFSDWDDSYAETYRDMHREVTQSPEEDGYRLIIDGFAEYPEDAGGNGRGLIELLQTETEGFSQAA